MSTPSVQYPKHLTDWIKKQLESFLGYPDDGQLTQHLLSFGKRHALGEYTLEMLGDNKAVREFTAELWRRKTGEKDTPTSAASRAGMGAAGPGGRSGLDERKEVDPTTAKMSPLKRDDDLYASATNTSSTALKAKEVELDPMKGRNLKVKYVQSKHGPSAPAARMMCHCQATTHLLFTNCTGCGKIVCEAEGEGPCFFCGSMVTQAGTFISEDFESWMRSMEPEDLVKRQTKQEQKNDPSDKAATTPAPSTAASSSSSTIAAPPSAEQVAQAAESAGLAKAEAQRNKLLSFASDKKKASQILDDQNDWFEFESNSWLSKEARAQKKAEADQHLLNLEKRKQHTLTLDIANKKIVTHSSDAWKESLEPEQTQPKWTDDVPSEGGLVRTHGSTMVAAMAGSRQLQQSVDEMKIVSRYQYFHNDTLTGRAKEVYQDLKQSLRASAASANVSASSTSVPPAAKPHNALLASLQKTAASGSRGAGFAATDPLAETEGLADDMSELQLEERLAWNRARAEESSSTSCAANDEDEPTNCAGALDARPSVYSDSADRGVTLSMWQPWASLLVLGIKRVEGRGWFTPHRGRYVEPQHCNCTTHNDGAHCTRCARYSPTLHPSCCVGFCSVRCRLWIASGSRETTPEEIEAVEAEYRQVYGPNAKIPFPKEYPTSALLGCVDLTHCWSAEEFQTYRENHGAGGEDSQSAFVFVCRNPRVLPLPQSHSGQHKLYNLPPKLYQALGPSLKPVNERWRLALPAQQQVDQGGFDLWPPTIRPTPSSSASSMAPSKPSISVLQPGLLLLKQGLSLQVQQSILDCVRHIGLLGADTGFTTPTYTDGPQMNLRMLCLNMFWNLNTKKWERVNARGKKMHAIPEQLLEHVDRMLTIAVDYLKAHGAGETFPHYVPDICIVNYYSASSGKLGMHQDKDETQASIKAGYPVISLSIGDTCEFAYGNKRIAEEKLTLPGVGGEKYNKVHLASGDVLLFGGPSRSIFHGVDKILPNTKPRELWMRQGRLNLTFRKL
jgi:alkylated DNA repair dioxygenase AlkB